LSRPHIPKKGISGDCNLETTDESIDSLCHLWMANQSCGQVPPRLYLR
jgi:hypothetical protein